VQEALKKLQDLQAQAMVSKQKPGKRSPRENIEFLLDPGTFVEIDMFVKHNCYDFGMETKKALGDGVVTGYGEIDGRTVYLFAQDITIIGGSLGKAHSKKITTVMDMALKARCPIIGLLDSGGARIQEGTDSLCGYGDIFYRNTRASGVIPQITAVLGTTAGGAVYSPALTDFIFQVDKSGLMFITGPAVVKAVTGVDITMEDLGGARVHTQISGVSDFFCEDVDSCLLGVRKLLSFFPANNKQKPPRVECTDDPYRKDEGILKTVPSNPKRSYDVHKVIKFLVDDKDFMEVKADFAKEIVVGFGRINGETVGIIANNAQFAAGVLSCDSSDKGARFIRFCDAFNISLLTLVDVPGYMPGEKEETKGIIRHGAKMLYAYSEATVPKITVILRKAYGGAYIAMCSKHLGADQVMAWPTAEIAVMGADGAANIIYKKDIDNSADPEATRAAKIAEYSEKFANPYDAAFKFNIDDVIDPRETRSRIVNALKAFANKDESLVWKKHGNNPF
jgi:acetyl-CoA carboxylase carboxyltransferase component